MIGGSTAQEGSMHMAGDKVVTLEDLRGRLGASSEAELREHFDGIPDSHFIEWGAEVATPRIVKDAPRILDAASTFLAHATEEQKLLLMAITADSLKLAVTAAIVAGEVYQAHSEAVSSATDSAAELAAMLAAARQATVTRRNILWQTLSKIGGKVEPYRSRLAAAYSKAETTEALCKTLTGLTEIGRQMLADETPGIAKRLKTTSLSSEWLQAADDTAAALKEAGERAGGVKAAPSYTQADVDLRDGWALVLLDEIVAAFDAGHEADSAIPRLALYRLRTALRPSTKKKKAEAPAGAPAEEEAAAE